MTEEQKEKMRENMKKARETKASKAKDLDDRLTKLEESIAQIAKAVETKSVQTPVSSPTSSVDEWPEPLQEEKGSGSMPRAWRKIVTSILGVEFKAERDEAGVLIYMPKGIDRRSGLEKDANRQDVSRAAPLRSGSELDDLRIWCQRIKDNILKKYPTYFNK